MLTFEPETIEQLKSRFLKALETSWSVKRAIKDSDNTPGKKREHVFDFEDGIRIIISRDRFEGIQVIHFSASFGNVESFMKTYPRQKGITLQEDKDRIVELMKKRFIEISGFPESERIKFLGTHGSKLIPHWIIPYNN